MYVVGSKLGIVGITGCIIIWTSIEGGIEGAIGRNKVGRIGNRMEGITMHVAALALSRLSIQPPIHLAAYAFGRL